MSNVSFEISTGRFTLHAIHTGSWRRSFINGSMSSRLHIRSSAWHSKEGIDIEGCITWSLARQSGVNEHYEGYLRTAGQCYSACDSKIRYFRIYSPFVHETLKNSHSHNPASNLQSTDPGINSFMLIKRLALVPSLGAWCSTVTSRAFIRTSITFIQHESFMIVFYLNNTQHIDIINLALISIAENRATYLVCFVMRSLLCRPGPI